MGRIEDDVARMGVLVNDLPALAQLDRERPLELGPVALLAVTADTIHDARVRVPGRHTHLDGFDGRHEPAEIPGRGGAPAAGGHRPGRQRARPYASGLAGEAVLEVSDTGPGVALQHVPHLSERLYRVVTTARPSRALARDVLVRALSVTGGGRRYLMGTLPRILMASSLRTLLLDDVLGWGARCSGWMCRRPAGHGPAALRPHDASTSCSVNGCLLL
ncbi:hypothetical protein ACIBK9_49935 [Nonomuraea sp. NPDC050227]|uniref:hypothetical protein n=1 Tax=Nonomuraea sp. NPDC050227 TaxID=3364360 RepID=UPI00378E5036